MSPYYQQDGITIYHGDCRDILPHLPKVDLVLTDPPYGIARVWKGGSGHGWGRASEQTDERNSWDGSTPDLSGVITHAPVSIVWGGNYFDSLPVSRGWLIWVKPERNFTLSEAELAWTNRDTVVRVYDGPRSDYGRVHPTQKPLRLMEWCIDWSGNTTQTILDPFMGSGTTLVAAKRLGRQAIGIEIEEKYCEIAAKRLAQRELFGVAS